MQLLVYRHVVFAADAKKKNAKENAKDQSSSAFVVSSGMLVIAAMLFATLS